MKHSYSDSLLLCNMFYSYTSPCENYFFRMSLSIKYPLCKPLSTQFLLYKLLSMQYLLYKILSMQYLLYKPLHLTFLFKSILLQFSRFISLSFYKASSSHIFHSLSNILSFYDSLLKYILFR